jgi:hypothetical protein
MMNKGSSMFEEPLFILSLLIPKQTITIYWVSIYEMGQAPCWQGACPFFVP